MNRYILVAVMAAVIALSGVSMAQDALPLGKKNIALKMDSIKFTEDAVENSDIDTGVYIGVEALAGVADNIYLGVEVGYAKPTGTVIGIDTELVFIPLELNVKYAGEAAPNLTMDFGTGASYIYVEETAVVGATRTVIDDWVIGAQFFGDVLYTSGNFFVGLNAKYQITSDFSSYDYTYSNFRIGGIAGFSF